MLRWKYHIVFSIACLVYANTLFNELVFDDQLLILEHTAIRDFANLREIWLGRFWGEIWPHNILYRPLTLWTLALNFGLNTWLGLEGPQPFLYHLVNLLLHAGTSLLVLKLADVLGLPFKASLFSSILFAVHPIHTEAVAMITARSELLAAGFGLGFLLLHRTGRVTSAVVCAILALCSKESAIAFLPVAFLMDALVAGSVVPRIKAHTLYGCAAALWFGVRHTVIEGIVPPAMTLPLSEVGTWERILTAAHIQVKYLILFVLPVAQSSDYSFNQIPVVQTMLDPFALLFLLLLTAGCWVVWTQRRKNPLVTLAVLGYAITFAPGSNFLIPIGTIMGERLAYAPSIFACLLVGLGWARMASSDRQIVTASAAAILVILASLTVVRNTTWANPTVFAKAQLASAPNSAKANYNAARALQTQGEIMLAIRHYQKAIDIKPLYPDAWNNLGVAYRDVGRTADAVRAGRQAVVMEPRHAKAHFNLGLAYEDEGRSDEAERAYGRAIDVDPAYAEALNNLATLLAGRGELDSAAVLWRRALTHRPDYEIARINLERLDAATLE